jgi:hypothetical protein
VPESGIVRKNPMNGELVLNGTEIAFCIPPLSAAWQAKPKYSSSPTITNELD